MKRNLFVKVLMVVLFCAVSVSVNAQNSAFSKGDMAANLGLGIGWRVGPAVSFEYGVADNLFNLDKATLGVGGYLGYALGNNNFIIGARGLFHYQFVDKLDTYGGVMIGFQRWGGLAISPLFAGARYYFKEKMGVFAELAFYENYSIGYLNLGLALKF